MKGIYGIKVDNCLVYVGQARDINERMQQHWKEILGTPKENKYFFLKSVLGRNKITFWLLEETEELCLDNLEYKWVKALHPCLNTIYMGRNVRNLDINDFYNTICNESHEIDGAIQLHYHRTDWRNKK